MMTSDKPTGFPSPQFAEIGDDYQSGRGLPHSKASRSFALNLTSPPSRRRYELQAGNINSSETSFSCDVAGEIISEYRVISGYRLCKSDPAFAAISDASTGILRFTRATSLARRFVS